MVLIFQRGKLSAQFAPLSLINNSSSITWQAGKGTQCLACWQKPHRLRSSKCVNQKNRLCHLGALNTTTLSPCSSQVSVSVSPPALCAASLLSAAAPPASSSVPPAAVPAPAVPVPPFPATETFQQLHDREEEPVSYQNQASMLTFSYQFRPIIQYIDNY